MILRCVFLLTTALLFTGCSNPRDSVVKDDSVLKGDTTDSNFHVALQEKRFGDAYSISRELIRKFPQNGSAWNLYGYACEHVGKLAEALEAYQKAVEVSPGHWKAWFNQGVVWSKLDQPKRERSCYDKAIAINPRDARSWLNLSSVLVELDKPDEAKKAFDLALELDPDIISTAEYLMQENAKPSNQPIPVEQGNSSSPQLQKEKQIDEDSPPAPISLHSESQPQIKLKLLQEPVQVQVKSDPLPIDSPSVPAPASVTPSTPSSKLISSSPVVAPTPSAPPLSPAPAPQVDLRQEAIQWESKGKWKEALTDYRQALKIHPNQASLWNDLGMAQVGNDQWEDALISFKRALSLAKLDRDRADVRSNLSRLHADLGKSLLVHKQPELAMSHLNQALQLNPQLTEARYLIGYESCQQEKWADALQSLEVVSKDKGAPLATWIWLGIAYLKTGQAEKALASFDHVLEKDRLNHRVCFLRGVTLVLLKRFQDAEAAFDRCLTLEPENGVDWHNLGITRLHLKNLDGAIQALGKAVQYRSDMDGSLKILADLNNITNKPDIAIDQYQNLLKRKKWSEAELWKGLGTSYELKKEWKSSVNAWAKAVQLDPKDGEAWAGYGQALSQIAQNELSAQAYFQAMKNGDPTPEVLNNLGIMFTRIGKTDDALRAFATAMKAAPQDPVVLMNTGILLHRMKKDFEYQAVLSELRKLDDKKAEELVFFTSKPAP